MLEHKPLPTIQQKRSVSQYRDLNHVACCVACRYAFETAELRLLGSGPVASDP